MNHFTTKTFKAQATFGQFKGFSNELIDIDTFKQELLDAQIENQKQIRSGTQC